MSSRHKKSKTKSRSSNSSGVPNVYPPVPGYPVPAQWLPPHPGAPTYPYQWYQPWATPPQSDQNLSWFPPVSTVTSTSQIDTPPKSRIAPGVPDEYTVDSLRRIYNNDDGSIEIERVKVLRRQGIYDTKQNVVDCPSECRSLIPISPNVLNERRPPPRKHRKRTAPLPPMHDRQEGAIPQGWYPYMSYLPQPFPYPYPFGYMWPMPPSSVVPSGYQSPTDESDCSVSRQETFPVSVDSPDLTQDKSRSPEFQRSSSSAATSHVTESLGTDIAPSDSVSMRGFKRETSLERILRKTLPSSDKPSDRQNLDDVEKTKEWMEDMQKAFESKSGLPSEIAGDRSSFATAPSDIPTPPTRPKTKRAELVSNSKMSRRKSNSESNIDNQEEQRNLVSLPLLESTRVSDSDLIYAFKKLEDASNVFKAHVTDINQTEHLESDVKRRKTSHDGEERGSRASTLSFHSTRQSASADEHLIDTDSTDIAVPIDSSTADESFENFDDSKTIEENYKWVLMHPRDTFENLQQNEDKPDDLIENWRTEVSLWRARLVVSLCRGEGLDQQDWATFQLLAHHPLPMNLKLSLLHAHRLCSQNYDVGVAMLRNALLHLTTFGETLMKPEEERPPGWKTIALNHDQPWVPVKGSMEILRVLGYRVTEDGILKYRRKDSPEVSVTARLTLDLLVLAEEFRLFLNGTHQYPLNITQLFRPRETQPDRQHHFEVRQSDKHVESHSGSKNEVERREENLQTETVLDDAEKIVDEQKLTLINQNEKEEEFQMEKKDEIPSNISDDLPLLSEISSDKIDPMTHSEKQSLPEPSDAVSSSTSIPDLQSQTHSLSSKLDEKSEETGSKETLTPTVTAEISEDKSLKESSKQDDEKEQKDENLSKKPNPEDHIYEEIGETKAQVEALKTKESLSQSPPPLPPKAKSSNQNSDIYPQTEWSVSSQCSSVLGGTTPRRKKRKAPKPPNISLSEKEENDVDTTLSESVIDVSSKTKSSVEYSNKVSRRPSDSNPFLEDIKPAGYIGKNPFYEDIDIGRAKKENAETSSDTIKSNEKEPASEEKQDTHPGVAIMRSSNEDVSEISEISVSNLPAGVRPQRKKGKTSTLKKGKNISVTFASNEVSKLSNDDKSSETDSVASVVTLTKANSETSQVNKLPKLNETHDKKIRGKKISPKNVEGEHQRDSQVVVSNKMDNTGKQDESELTGDNKRDIVIQQILITYDISLDSADTTKDKESKEIAAEKTKPNEKEFSKIQTSKDEVALDKNINETKLMEVNDEIPETLESNDGSKKRDSGSKKYSAPPPPTIRIDDNLKKTENLTRDLSKETIQVDKDSSKDMKEINQVDIFAKQPKEKSNNNILAESELPPPLLPPKAPLRLLDDIPYIDTNDVKSYRASYSSFGRSQPPHYGLTEIQSKTTTYSASCGDEKASTFLKRSSLVPFIDESDLPPESLPPPPPVSPPPTPPLLPPPPSPILRPDNITQIHPPPSLSNPPPSPPLPPPLTPPAIVPSLPSPPDSPPPSPPTELILISPSPHQHQDATEAAPFSTTLPEKRESEKTAARGDEDERKRITTPDHENPIIKHCSETLKVTEKIEPGATETSSSSHSESIAAKDDHFYPKSTVLFGTEDKHRTPEFYSPQSDADRYEIPEPPKAETDMEERYEIPDVTRASASVPFKSKSVTTMESSSKGNDQDSAKKNAEDSLPKRPPRHQLSFKAPPPRPPKPADLPPKLPPKTGSFKSSSAPSTTRRPYGSLPSTLIKIPSSKVQISAENNKSSTHTSHSLPSSSTKARETVSQSKSSPLKALSLSSIPSGSKDNKSSDSSVPASAQTSKSLPRTSYPSNKSVSMPSSPKVAKYPRKLSKEEKKRQKSWPSLFCDCVYPTNSNDDVKYVVK